MFERFHKHFGTAGLVVAIVALVAALAGGALAATGGSSGGQATASAKAKPGPRGKTGKTGPAGPAGPAGPVGTAGAAGTAGAKGDTGAQGEKGAQGIQGNPGNPGSPGTVGEPGKSVESLTIAPGDPAACDEQGGAEYEVEESGESTEICNGKEGSPWTAGGTLPPGATETGTWSFNAGLEDNPVFVPISFPIPLDSAFPEESERVHFQGEADFSTFCKGTVEAPEALSGQLCIYATLAVIHNATYKEVKDPGRGHEGTGTAGALLKFEVTGTAFGSGSFAVTESE